jgi:hypothetical protein
MDIDVGHKKNEGFVSEIIDHCLNQAFTQTPFEAFATRIKTPVGFNNFHLKNIIKVDNLFSNIRLDVTECVLNEFGSAKVTKKSANDLLLSLIYIIQLDDNLYYLFNLLFNFYNNTVGRQEEDLSKLRKTKKESLGFSRKYGCLIFYKILAGDFDSKTESMQEIMYFAEFPLYCAIFAVARWCEGLMRDIRDRFSSTILGLLDKKSVDFSSYNNIDIANEELYLLEELTLHKMDEDIDSKLKHNDNGISIADDKTDYTLQQLVFNYNQIHKIITGEVTEKLKQCAIKELQAYYSDKDTMDVSNKNLSIPGNNICIQCKMRIPIFYEENNNKNKFCTKICQMKLYNYIIQK